ncbi:protein Red-like [Argonauta hians]
MPKEDTEAYSNPLPPADYNAEVGDDAHPLTNEDFRKLLMTPRVAAGSSSTHISLSSISARSSSTAASANAGAASSASHDASGGAAGSSGLGSTAGTHGLGSTGNDVGSSAAGAGAGDDDGNLSGFEDGHDLGDQDDDDPATRRRKKKSYYARLKRLEEDRQKELAQKYRDRAKERRDGLNRDYAETEIISTTADYRAVAPDAKSGENYAERRKQIIQESKYLGGDMEHTHLVKGLDYALLEKVRAEITSKEREEEEEMEKALTQKKEKEEDPEDQILFKTKMGRNIYRIIFKSKYPERNELFVPSRMAYVVDLDDEFADSDVPTTLIRSKTDCPIPESDTTLTTNDIVINKLTQILSYLRQGRRENKKLKKKEKNKMKEDARPGGNAGGGGGGSGGGGDKMLLPGHDESIYGDLGEYNPSVMSAQFSKSKDKRDRKERSRFDRGRDRGDRDRGDQDRDLDHRDHDGSYYSRDKDRSSSGGMDRRDRDRGDRDYERDRSSKKTYFEKPADEDEDKDRMPNSAKDLVKSIKESFKSFAEIEEEKEKAASKKEEERLRKLKAKMEIDSYAECYPGMMESADAIDDSDDEVDYTKMDHGNKKGPIGRWDFDSQEEYSEYMANKEAMPKAAFQYGVKMADGRKTRRTGPKDEKAELDRQWQKIQRIIEKRKTTDDNYEYKRVKY